MCYLCSFQECLETIAVLIDLVLHTLQDVGVGDVFLARIDMVQTDFLYCLNKLDGSRDQCGRSCLQQSISKRTTMIVH